MFALKQSALAFWIIAGWQNAKAQPVTEIQVDLTSGQQPISPLLYGTNHRYFYDGCGMWDAAHGKAFEAFNAVYDDIGLRSIRYPGGSCANHFDWRKAIGPVKDRAVMGLKHGERVSFGLDECLQWAEKHGTEVVYMYNMADGSARDAADLVEYLNAPQGTNPNGGIAWAEVRAKNGHPAPYHIRYFEIGNEMFLLHQFYWLKDAGPDIPTKTKGQEEEYWVTQQNDLVKGYTFGCKDKQGIQHDGFIQYYSAMKAVDPHAQIYSCFGFPNFVDLMDTAHPYDGLVVHTYAKISETLPLGDFHDRCMQEAEKLSGQVLQLQNYMREKIGMPQGKDRHVVVTEYGIFGRLKNLPTPDYLQSVDHGLYIAEILMNFIRYGLPHAEKMCTLDDVQKESGHQGVFGPAPSFFATPEALAFKLFTHHFGTQLVASTIQGNPTKKVYDGTTLQKLDAIASTDSTGRLFLMVLNRDATDAVTAHLNTGTYGPKAASIWTLAGEKFTSANSAKNPREVRIAERSQAIGPGGLTCSFPAHSLTSIQFKK